MDAQLAEYRQRHQHRMEGELEEQRCRSRLWGPVRPSSCAAALASQLKEQVKGEMTDELQLEILQWALLARLGGEIWGQPEQPEEPTLLGLWRLLPCLGVRALETAARPDLGALLRSREALEALLLSGGCGQWQEATQQLCQLLRQEPSLLKGGWQLQLAVATAICVAEGLEIMDSSFTESAVDLFQRYQRYCTEAAAQRLFPSFRSLSAWHFRYVLGSWHSDDDLQWARKKLPEEYRTAETIGQAVKMVRYRQHNDRGVSVQDGLRFYDDQKATLPRILDYGGVCGAVSKFGASCCQAFGVAAMPVAQPGHCAMIWRGPQGRWCLENDCGGWNQSWMHDRIQRTWKELGQLSERAGIIPVAERAMAGDFRGSECRRLAAKLSPELAPQLLTDAVALCPHNLCAWHELIPVATPELLQPKLVHLEALARAGPWRLGRDLSLQRPVRASAPERCAYVVDGTDSEWFPTEARPQWLEIDLQKLSQVKLVRVKWWGDYGQKSSLRVLSLLHDEGPGFAYGEAWREQGRREHAAEFNGWTELQGWDEPTRALRLELGNPCPDCFGMQKSFGVRRVEVLGQHIEDPARGSLALGPLLQRFAEAAFPRPQEDVADQQGLHIVREMLRR